MLKVLNTCNIHVPQEDLHKQCECVFIAILHYVRHKKVARIMMPLLQSRSL